MNFRLGQDVKAALDKAAAAEGRTASSYVERAVVAALRAAGHLAGK